MSRSKDHVHDLVQRVTGSSSLEPLLTAVSELDVTDVGGEPVTLLILVAFRNIHGECWAKSLGMSQSALDICWEKLNSGYWRDVPLIWRTIYSYASIARCLSLVAKEEYQEALRCCDMGLLMGAPLPTPYLPRLAACLSNQLRQSCSSPSPPPPACKDETMAEPPLRGLAVERVHCPSLETFELQYMKKQVPVIITDAISHWPALTSRPWSLEYLRKVAANRTVPIEVGTRYTDEAWSQKLMTIGSFLDAIAAPPPQSSAGQPGESPVLYLAQHQLFEQLPELRADICVPDYCCLSEDVEDDVAEPIVNAWIGPCGTVSPLHHDPYHNVFAQVVGSKRIRIYSPVYSDMLYPHDSIMLNNTSQVDCERPDLARFPKFVEAQYWECVVKPGDLLYIPPKFWHYVRSLAVSFSVSFWWK